MNTHILQARKRRCGEVKKSGHGSAARRWGLVIWSGAQALITDTGAVLKTHTKTSSYWNMFKKSLETTRLERKYESPW